MADIDAHQESLVGNFIAVTGVDRERAIFFLQSSGWNLEASMGAFYDDSNPDTEVAPIQDSYSHPQIEPTTGKPPSFNKPNSGHERGGITTLSDYREKPGPPQAGGRDPQQFFAGGSEHSGQMIEGPPREKKTPDSIAKEVFEAAKKQGAISVEEEEKEHKSAVFHGAGFRLGDMESPSQSVRSGGPLPPKPEMVRHVLIFWKDGFSVDDGPLRSGESEDDRKFIDAVRKGEIPQELLKGARSGEVDVDIRDKRDEVYVKPKPRVVAFSGEGRKLGSYAPEVKSSKISSSSSSSSSSVDPPSVPLDLSRPTTSIQIRLADGSRLVTKFNHSHTINDIRQFINLSHPSTASYVLMTTFPNKELSDPTLTISEAQLLNAVIVQRIR